MENQSTASKPTSFIPAKTQLETVSPTKVLMAGIHIEGIHIAMFFGILAFLFLGLWKASSSAKK